MIVIWNYTNQEIIVKSHRFDLTTKKVKEVVKNRYPNFKFKIKSIDKRKTIGEFKVPSVAKVDVCEN